MSMLSGKRFTSLKKKKEDMSEMEKDKSTILMLYKDAYNKEEQLRIFKDLYLKEIDEVCKFLYDHGVDDQHIRRNLKTKHRWV